MRTVKYTLSKIQGYECVLEATAFPDYIHAVFSTVVEVPDQKPEPRKQFEMFLPPGDLQRLITALQVTQYDWHQQHNTERTL